jgi:dTDP-4-amino-4,6-dideoxy-D-galactose acyltransferase
LEIHRLGWDSNFFQKEIFSCTLSNLDEFYSAKTELVSKKAKLCYLFINHDNYNLINHLSFNNILSFDKKITYECSDLNYVGSDKKNFIQSYNGILTEELLELSFLAGHHSRFKKDKQLEYRFKDLYRIWIDNSLKRVFADELFVFYNNLNLITGFVTCKVENNTGIIGLIATNENQQGKGIGYSLIQAAHKWYIQNNITKSLVVTQGSNVKACNFYENCGYKVFEEVYVYHWWL